MHSMGRDYDSLAVRLKSESMTLFMLPIVCKAAL